MKIFILFIVIIFALNGCFIRNQNSASIQISVIEKAIPHDPYTWDFGQVKAGSILEHSFILKNETQDVLTITGTNTSCGCTVSKIEKKTLSPGENTLVAVQFNTKGYSGTVQQYIYVNTDSLDNSVLRFIIKADVVKQ